MRTIGLALLIALGLAITFEAEAEKKKVPTNNAKIEFKKGKRLYKAKKYDLAVDAFRRAYQLKPRWKYLFHVGRAEAAAGRPVLALVAYETYLAKGQKNISRKRRVTVQRKIAKLRAKIGEVRIQAPEGATVLLNGQEVGKAPLAEPVMVRANHDHTVGVLLNGTYLPEQTVRVAGLEIAALEFEKPPPIVATKKRLKPLPPLEIAGWSTLGAGTALLIAATATGAVALSLDKDDDIAKHDRLATSTYVLLSFGGAAAVAGSVILIIAYAQKEKNMAQMESFSVRPLVGPRMAGAAFEWRF